MTKQKIFKIVGISLGSLIAVVLIAVCVACWVVFTPDKVTPVVKKALAKTLTCETVVDTVDLTFFSTFPHFGVHLTNVTLKNDIDENYSETLCHVDDCTLSLNLMSLIRRKELSVTKCAIKHGDVNLWVNADGQANYMIVNTDTTDTTSSEFPLRLMDIDDVELSDVAFSYQDVSSNLVIQVDTLKSLSANLKWQTQNASAKLAADMRAVTFQTGDTTILLAHASSMLLKATGSQQGEQYSGKLSAEVPQLSLERDTINYVNKKSVVLDLPFQLTLAPQKLQLNEAKAIVDGNALTLDGFLASNDAGYSLDVNVSTPNWDITNLLTLVPETYTHYLDGIDVDGELAVSQCSVTGTYNDSTMPEIAANIALTDATFKYASFPYTLNNINGNVEAYININDTTCSHVTIPNLHVETQKSKIDATGEIGDLLGNPQLDIHAAVDVSLPDAKALLPDNIQLKGKVTGPLQLQTTLDDLTNSHWENLVVDGTLSLANFDMLYNDSIAAKMQKGTVEITVPSKAKNANFQEYGRAIIKTSQIDANIVGLGELTGKSTNINVGLSNPMNDSPLSLSASLAFSSIDAATDSLHLNLGKTTGAVSFYPEKTLTRYNITLHGDAAKVDGGAELRANADHLSVGGSLMFDSIKEDVLERWNPRLNIAVTNGIVHSNQLLMPVEMPHVKLYFTPSLLTINDGKIQIGSSDFSLSGNINNLQEWLNNDALLKGKVDFVSGTTDVYEIMDLVSGFGLDSAAMADENYEELENTDDNPFIVPFGTDLTLITKINSAVVGNSEFHNVQGKLRVKDGVLVLDEMGMTCDAATMQLTALYRSERRNHLFLGADFHLLNIDIDKLIDMIPAIDTIVPMLASFKGRAEFHLAAETYLKSDYTPKYSTLRGAASIEGKDLVLLDSETFSTIAKYLLFNKKTENKVDSMSLELTLFRNEVELFPFLIQMDKYQAVVQGRYSLTPHYNAHIETLAPIRLALNIEGNEEANFKFRLGKTQYGNMYKPEKRNAVQERTLALKKLISDALKETLKDEEYFQDNGN